MTHAEFVRRTVDWINRRLVQPGARVEPDTPLFANGLIDSIRILKLIAWTEEATGARIPDEMIRMDHFQTVERIAGTFLTETGGDEPASGEILEPASTGAPGMEVDDAEV